MVVIITNLGHRYSATTLSLPIHAHGILGEAVRQTLRARGGSVEHGVGVSRLDHGRDVGDMVGQEGLGRRAAFAVLRAVGGAGEPCLPREDAQDGHEAGAEGARRLDEQERDADAALERVGVLPLGRVDAARARGAVVLVGGRVADRFEAVDELAEALLGAAEGVNVALGRGRRAALRVRAEAERDLLVEGRVRLELVVEWQM